jgi:hypothetical protein
MTCESLVNTYCSMDTVVSAIDILAIELALSTKAQKHEFEDPIRLILEMRLPP